MDPHTRRLTRAYVHMDRLTHNLKILERAAGGTPLWPVVKANAYGHGVSIVVPHLVGLGYTTLGVADVAAAIPLIEADVGATFIVLSATLAEHSEALVAYGCEPVVCTTEAVESLAAHARRLGRQVLVHLKVDTGMGRIGIRPDQVTAFLERCRSLPEIRVRGLMSHFPRADEADKDYSLAQLARFREVVKATRHHGIEMCHAANSAAIFDLPGARFDAVRPGIAIYGLKPSGEVLSPLVKDLQPVLELKTQIVFIKEVDAGVGLSYGHDYHSERRALIATIPVGYGDGISRTLSGRFDVLIGGRRCPQVGRITMDMSLVDVTALRGRVNLGDEVVLIGRQNDQQITADELAFRLDNINYEVVTRISHRVPRIAHPPTPKGPAPESPGRTVSQPRPGR